MNWIKIGIEIGKIDCIRAGRMRRHGRGHSFSGRKRERAKFLLRSGRGVENGSESASWIVVGAVDTEHPLRRGLFME
jgi:hypothetical protein